MAMTSNLVMIWIHFDGKLQENSETGPISSVAGNHFFRMIS